MWKRINGYLWSYRIDDEGHVEKWDGIKWVRLTPYISGRDRACVKMRTKDNRKVDVPVVNLMADAFMGGKKPGECIIHKNGSKLDCAIYNLKKVSKSECGKISSRNRRRAVAKIDRTGTVLQIYPSAREAAKQNHLSQTAVWHRCTNKLKYPFELDGTTYQYMNN